MCARVCTFVLLCFHGILAAITDSPSKGRESLKSLQSLTNFFLFLFFTRVRQMAPVILSSLGFLDCSPLVFPTSPCWLDCTLQLLDSKTCEWAKASLSFVGATGRSGGWEVPFKCPVSYISPLAQTQRIWRFKNPIFLLHLAGSSAGTSRK